MPPFIPDNGDGVDIGHLIDNSEAGAWSKELARLAQMGCGPICDGSGHFTEADKVTVPSDVINVQHRARDLPTLTWIKKGASEKLVRTLFRALDNGNFDRVAQVSNILSRRGFHEVSRPKGNRRSGGAVRQTCEKDGDVARIEIPKGTVVIDIADWEILQHFTFRFSGKGCGNYVGVTERKTGRTVRLSRFLCNPPKSMVVDHINGDPFDNRRVNLRVTTSAQNSWNRAKLTKKTSSKYKGVSKQNKGWFACIYASGNKQVPLGVFEKESDAARAYDKAARERFGSYAAVNFPRQDEQCALRNTDNLTSHTKGNSHDRS